MDPEPCAGLAVAGRRSHGTSTRYQDVVLDASRCTAPPQQHRCLCPSHGPLLIEWCRHLSQQSVHHLARSGELDGCYIGYIVQHSMRSGRVLECLRAFVEGSLREKPAPALDHVHPLCMPNVCVQPPGHVAVACQGGAFDRELFWGAVKKERHLVLRDGAVSFSFAALLVCRRQRAGAVALASSATFFWSPLRCCLAACRSCFRFRFAAAGVCPSGAQRRRTGISYAL